MYGFRRTMIMAGLAVFSLLVSVDTAVALQWRKDLRAVPAYSGKNVLCAAMLIPEPGLPPDPCVIDIATGVCKDEKAPCTRKNGRTDVCRTQSRGEFITVCVCSAPMWPILAGLGFAVALFVPWRRAFGAGAA